MNNTDHHLVQDLCGGQWRDLISDVKQTPSVAYVTFGWIKLHEFVEGSIDTRLHMTDKTHVGGSVFTDGGRLSSKCY